MKLLLHVILHNVVQPSICSFANITVVIVDTFFALHTVHLQFLLINRPNFIQMVLSLVLVKLVIVNINVGIQLDRFDERTAKLAKMTGVKVVLQPH